MVECPGCGGRFEGKGLPSAPRARAAGECLAAYHDLTVRTLTLADAKFVHQHAVDAWTGQHAGPTTPLVGTFFALAGLHLALEKGYDGREVQRAHVAMARRGKDWPAFTVPDRLQGATVLDVLPRADLSVALREWMADVWQAWSAEQDRVRALTEVFVS